MAHYAYNIKEPRNDGVAFEFVQWQGAYLQTRQSLQKNLIWQNTKFCFAKLVTDAQMGVAQRHSELVSESAFRNGLI
ncbi:MAG: hypothetical protein PUF61_04025 [Spirochaetales bacterium]|nr:hypothetical protein [Spirochaetales bacterium]